MRLITDRVPVQIAVAFPTEGDQFGNAHCVENLYALCNDGTIWRISGDCTPPDTWTQLADVPQPDDAK